MNTRFLFCILLIGLGGGTYSHVYSQSAGWKLVLENDSQGEATVGSVDSLISAIRSGAEVRIAWSGGRPSDSLMRVEHLTDAKFLTIMSGKTVQAQIDPIIGQTPDFEAQQITFKENLSWCLLASTNGKADHIMRNEVTGEIISHRIRQRSFKWYVRK
ncbi:MAG: hypothetical protein AAF824_18745 [Bacteroidota bacterium]